jgi:hypothetical protein
MFEYDKEKLDLIQSNYKINIRQKILGMFIYIFRKLKAYVCKSKIIMFKGE